MIILTSTFQIIIYEHDMHNFQKNITHKYLI
jgi:hypothetical protein